MNEPSTLDINGVMKYLPHRYPFLLVDRVLEFVSGKSLRALKPVTPGDTLKVHAEVVELADDAAE